MSSKLTIDDLHLIITKLLSARNEWREIGTALGLKDFDIEGINSTNPQRALSTVLSTVLKIKSLTWGKLIDVLREPSVSQNALANKLAKGYGEFFQCPIASWQQCLLNLTLCNHACMHVYIIQ